LSIFSIWGWDLEDLSRRLACRKSVRCKKKEYCYVRRSGMRLKSSPCQEQLKTALIYFCSLDSIYFMAHFTKRIETSHGIKTFYFNRIVTEEVMQYHVSVLDKNSKANIFLMRETEAGWRIVSPNAELWIMEMEERLAAAINEHLMDV